MAHSISYFTVRAHPLSVLNVNYMFIILYSLFRLSNILKFKILFSNELILFHIIMYA